MPIRPPKNLTNTLSFKSGVIKTGADVLETELLQEKAFSLGLAEKTMIASLTELKEFSGSDVARSNLVKTCAEHVQAYFIQRELLGFHTHDHPIEHYDIPKEILSKVGAS